MSLPSSTFQFAIKALPPRNFEIPRQDSPSKFYKFEQESDSSLNILFFKIHIKKNKLVQEKPA